MPKARAQGQEIEGPGDRGSESLSGALGAQKNAALLRRDPELLDNKHLKIPYPPQARIRNIQGVVRLKLSINELGQVTHAEVLNEPAQILSTAALQLMRRLSFLPTTDDIGHAIVASVEHEVVFRLTES